MKKQLKRINDAEKVQYQWIHKSTTARNFTATPTPHFEERTRREAMVAPGTEEQRDFNKHAQVHRVG